MCDTFFYVVWLTTIEYLAITGHNVGVGKAMYMKVQYWITAFVGMRGSIDRGLQYMSAFQLSGRLL